MRRDLQATIRAGSAALLALVAGAACGASEGGGQAPEPPVLVVAVDGFEWGVVLPLLRAGRMPALAGLMERGTFGALKTMKPCKSPRLWTTVATGKAPSEHGILGFTFEEQGRTLHYVQADRRTKAFWNVLGDQGIASDTIGWWVTFPAEPVLGAMVAQTNTGDVAIEKGGLVAGLAGQVWPPELEEQVFAALEASELGLDRLLAQVFGELPDMPPKLRKVWNECRWAFRADETYLAILRARLAQGPPSRVSSIYVGGTDVVGHRFWNSYDPAAHPQAPTPLEIELFGGVIPHYYAHVDDMLAELLRLFPEDTVVLIVADHGMQLGEHHGDEHGLFLAAGPGIRASGVEPGSVVREDIELLGRLADFCPTLLTLVGVPYGEDMLGRPLAGLFTPEFLARHPPTSVPTHDDTAWRAQRDKARAQAPRLEDEERIEQLRQLGYLGDELDEDD